ncbi:hypothetical protein FM107_03400 [Sphingobacterium sp. JB170]|nr:hypothetical protein FM107_03400 [Sphingobacterium sp. JB170]
MFRPRNAGFLGFPACWVLDLYRSGHVGVFFSVGSGLLLFGFWSLFLWFILQ